MNLQILFWIFIVLFSVTAIITLLGITGVIKTIKDNYLNALFTALIIEVIAAVVGAFKGMDLEQAAKIPPKIFEKTHLEASGDIHEDTQNIIEAILESDKNKALVLEIDSLKRMLDECAGSLKEMDKDFYSYIIKLRNAMNEYPERSINIAYQPENKQKELELIKNVFIILDEFENPGNISQIQIQEEWVEFKKRHGRDQQNKYHILEYDINLLVRDFLNKYYAFEITSIQ